MKEEHEVETIPCTEEAETKFLQCIRCKEMLLTPPPAVPCVTMPQPPIINPASRIKIIEESFHVKNEIFGLECKLLDMWDDGSPHTQLNKKQEENIISIQQRIKMLDDSGKKKDLIINKYEEKVENMLVGKEFRTNFKS